MKKMVILILLLIFFSVLGLGGNRSVRVISLYEAMKQNNDSSKIIAYLNVDMVGRFKDKLTRMEWVG